MKSQDASAEGSSTLFARQLEVPLWTPTALKLPFPSGFSAAVGASRVGTSGRTAAAITHPLLQIVCPESPRHIPALFLDHTCEKKNKKTTGCKGISTSCYLQPPPKLHLHQPGTAWKHTARCTFSGLAVAADEWAVQGRSGSGVPAGHPRGSGHPLRVQSHPQPRALAHGMVQMARYIINTALCNLNQEPTLGFSHGA